jgi:hypothetical protein
MRRILLATNSVAGSASQCGIVAASRGKNRRLPASARIRAGRNSGMRDDIPVTKADESQVLSPATLRAMKYIRMLETQGVYCTPEDLASFVKSASPSVTLRDNYADEAEYDLMTTHHYVVVNTVEKYLIEVGWVESTARGIELTKLGRAVAAGADGAPVAASGPTVVDIALDGNDPLAYAEFLVTLQRKARGADMMLIDPYLPSAHVPLLLDSAGITRILTADVAVRDAGETSADRRKNFGLFLGARTGRAEIRLAKKGAVHDRLVLPAKGTGIMIGRSLGGRQLTAVVELNDSLTSLLRANYELVWAESTDVPPADLAHVAPTAEAPHRAE